MSGMKRLSKMVEEYATITINGNKQFVKPYSDEIHLAFSSDGSRWGIPLHIAQLTNHPSTGDYKAGEGIKAAGKVLAKWLTNPERKDLGSYGVA